MRHVYHLIEPLIRAKVENLLPSQPVKSMSHFYKMYGLKFLLVKDAEFDIILSNFAQQLETVCCKVGICNFKLYQVWNVEFHEFLEGCVTEIIVQKFNGKKVFQVDNFQVFREIASNIAVSDKE